MLEKLDAGYDAKTTASVTGKMTKLVSTKYCNAGSSISKHIDRMSALVEQLHGMKADTERPLAITFLVVSIELDGLRAVTKAIKRKAEKDLTWGFMAERLVGEHRALVKKKRGELIIAAAHVDSVPCQIYDRNHHNSTTCFHNPLYFKSKRRLSDKMRSQVANRTS